PAEAAALELENVRDLRCEEDPFPGVAFGECRQLSLAELLEGIEIRSEPERLPHIGENAATVVDDFEGEPARNMLEAHIHLPRARVFDRVVQHFGETATSRLRGCPLDMSGSNGAGGRCLAAVTWWAQAFWPRR